MACGAALLLGGAVGAPLRADVTYQEKIRPLFQESCLNCHNPDKRKAGLDLSSYDATMDGSDNGKVVELGDADKSVLYKVLTHAEEPFMPKGADKLPDSEIDVIRQWIAANAPEKAGGAVAKTNAGPAVAAAAVEEKPTGPIAMPKGGLLEPYAHTIRTGAVPSVAGSPWAPLVALAGQEQVLLYNTDTLDLVGVLPFPEGFPAVVRFSHNGSLLIAGGGVGAKLGHVVIWDVVTGKRITEVGDEFDTVIAADISPDQKLVALGGPSRLVKIFSTADGQMICKMKKHTDWVTALCFTPDGKALISGDRAGGMSVWDCQGHELQSVSAHAAGITGIACRGSYVATSSEDGTVKFWDIVEGKELKSWQAHDGGVRSIAFTADGNVLTSGRDHLVRLWGLDGKQLWQSEPLSDIAMQAVAAGGKVIAADWNGQVKVWNADHSPGGELDSNPPTIAQRIDTLNTNLASLDAAASKEKADADHARQMLAAAQKRVADAAAAFTASKGALDAARGRLDSAKTQGAEADAAIYHMRSATKHLRAAATDLAVASEVDPLIRPVALSVGVCGSFTEESLAIQEAQFAPTLAELAAAYGACTAEKADADAKANAREALEAALRAAQAAVASAQAAEDKTAAQIKVANRDLVFWRTAEAQAHSDPEYASRKTDGK
jgi:hypothetical protein